MFNFFRIVSIVEGLSYLTILSVTLEIISREYIFNIGMFHGVLFMIYIIASLIVSDKKGWPILIWLALFVASVVPFAFIAVEIFLRKESNRSMPSENA